VCAFVVTRTPGKKRRCWSLKARDAGAGRYGWLLATPQVSRHRGPSDVNGHTRSRHEGTADVLSGGKKPGTTGTVLRRLVHGNAQTRWYSRERERSVHRRSHGQVRPLSASGTTSPMALSRAGLDRRPAWVCDEEVREELLWLCIALVLEGARRTLSCAGLTSRPHGVTWEHAAQPLTSALLSILPPPLRSMRGHRCVETSGHRGPRFPWVVRGGRALAAVGSGAWDQSFRVTYGTRGLTHACRAQQWGYGRERAGGGAGRQPGMLRGEPHG